MKGLTLTLIGVTLAGLFYQFSHGDAPKAADELMKQKLEHSQKVLEGIALSDFDKIAKHADELMQISKRAGWRVYKTPRYEAYSNAFRGSAEELVKHAKAKNLDAATLAYVELTLTCVKCHKHVREKPMVRLD